MSTLTAFSKYVSAAGKAEMIDSELRGEYVTITLYDGYTIRGSVNGTGVTPDGDALLYLTPHAGESDYIFAEQIASVTS